MNTTRTIFALLSVVLAACPANTTPTPSDASRRSAPSRTPPSQPDWCAEHRLPESKCTKCNPGLIAEFKAKGDWCAGHGFPESVCPFCNPATPPGTPAADWCKEHRLPESKCTKCNPALEAKYKAEGDWCPEHEFPESVCPFCNPAKPPPGYSAIAPGTQIRFKTAKIASDSGVETVPAKKAALAIGVECTARLEFNRNRLADIRAPVPGVVRAVHVDLGQPVKAGTALFALESPRVGDMQGRLRSARKRVEVSRANHKRQQELRRSDIASERQLDVARQELETAESELAAIASNLRIAGASGGSGRYTLRTPIAGNVVRRPATIGTFATEETSLATIADVRTVWAMLEVREADAAAVRVGQPVTVTIEGAADRSFTGSITWVAAEVDVRTRTVAARAEIDNADGLLRANQFARAVVSVDAAKDAVAVPSAAVQRVDEESVVFVRTGDGLYEPRPVKLGRIGQGLTQVVGEVAAGDPVVTSGAYLLKTELMKDSIGAGCCEVEPPEGE